MTNANRCKDLSYRVTYPCVGLRLSGLKNIESAVTEDAGFQESLLNISEISDSHALSKAFSLIKALSAAVIDHGMSQCARIGIVGYNIINIIRVGAGLNLCPQEVKSGVILRMLEVCQRRCGGDGKVRSRERTR